MGRNLEPKCKACRREGEKLYRRGEKCLTAKCPIVRRGYKPGLHGPTSRTRLTPYGTQLREKQKAKSIYGLMEKQFRGYFEKAKKKTGNTTDLLVQLLEMRLDNVVYRVGLGRSRSLSRQLISHGHVRVNGRKVTIPSYQTKPGDVVSLTEKVTKSRLFEHEANRLEKYTTPSWLSLDITAWSGKVLNVPVGEDLSQNFNTKLIVEFYSR